MPVQRPGKTAPSATVHASLADAERRAERFALIVRVGHLITADLRLDDMLQRAADAVHELLGYENVAIPLYDADNDVLVATVFGGEYKRVMRGSYRLPVNRGIMGAAVTERRSLLVNDVQNDPRWLPTPGFTDIRAELAVPIVLGDRVLGVLNVESVQEFSDDDAQWLQVVAEQLAVAIENARLFANAEEAAALTERARLARDLHDAVTQAVFSMTLIAQSLAPAWRRDPAEGERRVQRLLELAGTAHAELRALLRELMPPAPRGAPLVPSLAELLVNRGLISALSLSLDHVSAGTPSLDVVLDGERYVPQAQPVEEALLRIASEAVTNAARHANARNVAVVLAATREIVTLEIRDDGVGFESNTRSSRGFGLRTMHERTASLGGTLDIASQPGLTIVSVSVPCIRPSVSAAGPDAQREATANA